MRPIKMIVVLSATAVSMAAHADVFRFVPGTMCHGDYQDWQDTYYEERGIANASTTNMKSIVCPARPRDTSTGETCLGGAYSVVVNYDDETETNPFWCEMYKVSASGTMTFAAPRFTCASPSGGGCAADLNREFKGIGQLTPPGLNTNCTDGTYKNFGAVCGAPPTQTPGTSFIILLTSVTPS